MLRLAVAQAPADLPSTSTRMEWLQDVLPSVAEAGATLVVLPELFACGYNIGHGVVDRAEDVHGPTFQAMARLASDSNIAIHYGFSERSGSNLFNAAACVSPQGTLLCHQRKLAIPPGFERTYFSAGQGCRLFEYGGLKIATLICYGAEFPETVRHVASMGADLVLVPTALGAQWSWVAHSMIPTRAYENGIYLAYVNSAGVENGMEFLGASVIAAPDGTEAARAGAEPEILYADLTTPKVKSAQARLPYLQDRSGITLS